MAKRGRRLTRDEKSCLLKQGLNPKEYEFAYDVNDSYFKVRKRETGIEKLVDKYRKAKNRFDY